ncbi:hypothetical protein EPD60_12665 [Flaviaesturariibacter flavus]|uniref:Uncharacterized protein n=1 Tax=Flaviaesturariibacter flavus TaxID=2502780 RepID=A0A4R1B965_9BACT|nr:hypothetical protein [Flaviaesturariibacter flavus]TCJ13243.1 hypothetical protein EPD60_12665 [Flaviaesturariibacter flavus]
MKANQLLFAVLMAFQGLACGAQGSRTSISNHNGETQIIIENNKEDLDLTYKGELVFNEAETAIERLTPGSRLRFRNGDNKLEVSADASGALQYRCNGGTASAQLSAGCAPLMKQLVDLVIRSGAGAKERAARIYAKGGFNTLMKEVDRLPGDYVRSLYLKAAMEQPALTPDNWSSLAGRIRTIESDYEKGVLLKKLLESPAAAATALPAVFDAASTMGSDYEKANVLQAAFRQKVDASWYPKVMTVATSIKSDYEKARVLKAAAVSPGIAPDALLPVAATIGSDYEKAGVLKMLADKAGNNEAFWLSLLNTARGIQSDYEKAGVLIQAAKRMPRTQKVVAEYRKTAATIQSEYELGRATKAIGTEA